MPTFFDGFEIHGANGWPLADHAPMDVWYSFDERGYADWPSYRNETR